MAVINVDDIYTLDNTGKQVDDAVDYALANSNRNLLDNPWFTVNQRGYTSNNLLQLQYWADRWLRHTSNSGQGSLSLSNGIVTLTAPSGSGRFGNIIQRMADPSIISGKVVTLSLLKSDGTIIGGSFKRVAGTSQFAYNQNNIKLQIAPKNVIVVEVENGASISFKAVKLELGSYSTLANDLPPDYAEELRKCMYYFRRISNTSGYTQLWLLGRNRSATGADFHGALGNQPMRTAPTISRSGSIYVQNADTNIAITDLTRYFTVSSDLVLRATVESGLTANAPSALALGSGAYIDLSADLPIE